MVGEHSEIYLCLMAKNALKLSTVVGEILKIYLSQVVKMHLNYPPCLGVRKVWIYLSQVAINALKLSTMVGENFEI